jgi:hypothetical protein
MRKFFVTAWLLVCVSGLAGTNDFFAIQVVDQQTGRGVPLVEMRTVNKAAWWTDSNGWVAFDEPGLMDREVFFHIRSPGYEYPKDMFDNRGVKLKTKRGGSAIIKLKRLNIAERLYRITGQGIYRDSVLLSRQLPLKQPLLNAEVLGQDTVIATLYRGRIYWFWGDTDRGSYPLGNFGASGATSELPVHGGLDPGVGVDLTYFADESGFSKPMCRLPGSGAHWIQALLPVRDQNGKERLAATVANQAHLGDAESWDVVLFNDRRAVFEPVRHWDFHEPHESAHPFRARVDGVEYFYLFPNWRVKADLESISERTNYEALTCVAGDGKVRGKEMEMERDGAGRVCYRWKAGADRLSAGRMRKLIATGKLKLDESWMDLQDFETGTRVEVGGGSVFWNSFRQRWVMLNSGRRAGELWFAEADTPSGPWAYTRRVVTHGDYNFYNPTQDPFFDQDGGRLIYFEGTYSDFFSGAKAQTPRYDYNQLMYLLTLDDPRLALPVAFYRVRETGGASHIRTREQIEKGAAWERIQEVAWHAFPAERHGTNSIPVYESERNGSVLSLTRPAPDAQPLFFALPLLERESENKLDGTWEFHAAMPDGSEFKFSADLLLKGEVVEMTGLGEDTTGSGTFRGGNVSLTFKSKDGTYLVEGRLEQRRLAGNWCQQGAAAKGTWTATWIDSTPSEGPSPALVILREFRRLDNGARVYCTEVEPPAGCAAESTALCRVWRRPNPTLVLEWKAQAVPMGAQ